MFHRIMRCPCQLNCSCPYSCLAGRNESSFSFPTNRTAMTVFHVQSKGSPERQTLGSFSAPLCIVYSQLLPSHLVLAPSHLLVTPCTLISTAAGKAMQKNIHSKTHVGNDVETLLMQHLWRATRLTTQLLRPSQPLSQTPYRVS